MLTVTDPADPTINFTAQTGSDGSYGSFTLTDSGAWTYTLDNDNPAVQALAAGDEVTDSFPLQASDNTPATVRITITGANDDATEIGGMTTGSVTEDAATATATGTLTAVDPDGPDDTFQPTPNTAGTYGIFTLAAGGDWIYTLDNTPGDAPGRRHQRAAEGGINGTDRFTVSSTSGLQATVTITVSGANDAPTANAGSDQSVTEGDTATLTGAGSSDPDTGDSLAYVWTQTGGTPTVTLAGAATATAIFTAPEFAMNMNLTFTLTVTDSQSATATDTVTITVQADDDAPTISGDMTGDVTEDDPTMATAVGMLTATDPDDPDNMFRSQTGAEIAVGTYGDFSLTAGGVWTYTLDSTPATLRETPPTRWPQAGKAPMSSPCALPTTALNRPSPSGSPAPMMRPPLTPGWINSTCLRALR